MRVSVREVIDAEDERPGPVVWLQPDEREVSTARAFVADAVAALGLSGDADVSLLTSELVSNAVEHAVTERIAVGVSRRGNRARVEVHDQDPARPHLQHPDPRRAGGVGLQLVDALAQAWGVDEIADDGKVVWFEIELPSAPTPTLAGPG